ncbi:glucans biosynthesis glucosyltransferase MdoH [Aquisalinus flavus]|uniref:Glucans biosynthesis glucosyltransferase H n=1 Tax=Aquisalinus flavus TaxID=1526572 RepID=A0A8J2Y7Q1_9PROT|nr:glucans biosynthesis glucosyltransferase MdoH [Aquisalinus flavus]MBD0425234.1 glucans biosynthesis glucosyltransferase MdoH [Aquisalinus flavus]UNE49106.1 glucans biosynthesis glucosyltransferase MdoH [Aquisalinus flavus]GGD17665.1 glucans biosynthesis glucosyltransferase H [Aquisalinus flavus]
MSATPFDPPRPPEAALAMPAQDFGAPGASGYAVAGTKGSSIWRKGFVGGAASTLTAWGAMDMYRVLDVGGMTALEWALLIVFTLNIVWICFAFVSATIGFLTRLVQILIDREWRGDAPLKSRNVVAFPIYNEDIRRIAATIETIAAALHERAPGHFECFILSDTTNPDIALLEEEAFLRIRQRLPEGARVFYRRRTINRARKSGNVEDFISRWGGRYDHMIVYDADSYMEAETLIEMARRMEADPGAGLIQTVPKLIGATTVFGRAQQFAANLYGPLLGTGVAWWAQKEGNFWGHNAIIRLKAFAAAAGLPALPGKAPFGGNILSHDFVEAALLRKAGWTVNIAADLKGSYEECPPTIIDLTIRDRRWCQGNLQHAAVLMRGRDIPWTNRLHLMIGVMSYLASPLWLLLIMVGMALSLQGKFLQPEYFGGQITLFPNWPVIDYVRALTLFVATMGILFAPKIYGMILGLVNPLWRRSVGPVKIVLGVLTEMIISILVAPILMAAQTSAVFSILSGRDTGWAPQRREGDDYSVGDVMRRHGLTMAFGVILIVSAFIISPVFAAWLAPAAIGMIFAGPISLWTGAAGPGRRFRKIGLLSVPEEKSLPPAYAAAQEARAAYGDLTALRFDQIIDNPPALARRQPLVDMHWHLADGQVHEALALARARLDFIADTGKAVGFLSQGERMALLNDPGSLQMLADRLSAARKLPATGT